MIRYTKIEFWDKMAGTLVNSRRFEVIPTYAKKNKSAHGLPRQHTMKMGKAL